MYVCMYVCIFIYMYMYVCVCVCVCVYIHMVVADGPTTESEEGKHRQATALCPRMCVRAARYRTHSRTQDDMQE